MCISGTTRINPKRRKLFDNSQQTDEMLAVKTGDWLTFQVFIGRTRFALVRGIHCLGASVGCFKLKKKKKREISKAESIVSFLFFPFYFNFKFVYNLTSSSTARIQEQCLTHRRPTSSLSPATCSRTKSRTTRRPQATLPFSSLPSSWDASSLLPTFARPA